VRASIRFATLVQQIRRTNPNGAEHEHQVGADVSDLGVTQGGKPRPYSEVLRWMLSL
jgi:hypothetical protein